MRKIFLKKVIKTAVWNQRQSGSNIVNDHFGLVCSAYQLGAIHLIRIATVASAIVGVTAIAAAIAAITSITTINVRWSLHHWIWCWIWFMNWNIVSDRNWIRFLMNVDRLFWLFNLQWKWQRQWNWQNSNLWLCVQKLFIEIENWFFFLKNHFQKYGRMEGRIKGRWTGLRLD